LHVLDRHCAHRRLLCELAAGHEHHQGRERDDEGGQEPLLPRRRHGVGFPCAVQATASTKFCAVTRRVSSHEQGDQTYATLYAADTAA
jgi:hypothetical protein